MKLEHHFEFNNENTTVHFYTRPCRLSYPYRAVWLAPTPGTIQMLARDSFLSFYRLRLYEKEIARLCFRGNSPRSVSNPRKSLNRNQSSFRNRSPCRRYARLRDAIAKRFGRVCISGWAGKTRDDGTEEEGRVYFERVVTRAYRSRDLISIDVEILVALVPQMNFVSGSGIVTTIRRAAMCEISHIARCLSSASEENNAPSAARFRIKRVWPRSVLDSARATHPNSWLLRYNNYYRTPL